MAAGDASAGPPGRVEAESAASVYYAPNARTASLNSPQSSTDFKQSDLEQGVVGVDILGQFERGETEITSSIHSGVRAGLDLHERVRVIRNSHIDGPREPLHESQEFTRTGACHRR